jgi:hypothetical protein
MSRSAVRWPPGRVSLRGFSGSPRRAARSARNYPQLVAEALAIDLIDVTYSGATANILTESQFGAPPRSAEPWTVGAGLPLSFLVGKPARSIPMLRACAVADLVIGLGELDGCG